MSISPDAPVEKAAARAKAIQDKKEVSSTMRFELTRAKPNGVAGRHLYNFVFTTRPRRRFVDVCPVRFFLAVCLLYFCFAYICLPVRLFCLFAWLPVCLPACLRVRPSVCVPACLPVVCLCVCVAVVSCFCLSVHLSAAYYFFLSFVSARLFVNMSVLPVGLPDLSILPRACPTLSPPKWSHSNVNSGHPPAACANSHLLGCRVR